MRWLRLAVPEYSIMKFLIVVLTPILAGIAVLAKDAASSEFAVSPASSLQGSPALAGDAENKNFLVVWTDNRSEASGLDIYARMVAADGTLLSPDIPLAEAHRGQAFPAVALDSKRDRFLVVWTDWRNAPTVESDIYGRFIGGDGSPAGPEFPIADQPVSQKFPAVAFDPAARRYLVVWIDRRDRPYDTLYARFLDADGNFLGPNFRLAGSIGDQRRPSVILDRNRGRFLVVWWERQNAAIYARFVTDPLDDDTPPIKITDRHDPRPAANLAVAVAPDEDRFFMVWSREGDRDRQGLDVYGQFIDGANGAIIGRPIAIADGTGREQSAVVAFDPRNKRFLVVWLERRRDTEEVDIRIHGRFVSLDGDLSETFMLSNPDTVGPKRSPTVGFNALRSSFLILWEDGSSGAPRRRQIFGSIR